MTVSNVVSTVYFVGFIAFFVTSMSCSYVQSKIRRKWLLKDDHIWHLFFSGAAWPILLFIHLAILPGKLWVRLTNDTRPFASAKIEVEDEVDSMRNRRR